MASELIINVTSYRQESPFSRRVLAELYIEGRRIWDRWQYLQGQSREGSAGHAGGLCRHRLERAAFLYVRMCMES